jgi:hypothetical protein
MEFNEDMPFIDDSHEGDTVTLVSNVGGRKDKKFSRNYAWAKHAADRGKLKEIVVKVVANGESYRTVDAFRRAVGRPHPATRVFVDGDAKHALAIVDEVTKIVPVPVKPEVKRVEAPVKPEVPAEVVANPEAKPEAKKEVLEEKNELAG